MSEGQQPATLSGLRKIGAADLLASISEVFAEATGLRIDLSAGRLADARQVLEENLQARSVGEGRKHSMLEVDSAYFELCGLLAAFKLPAEIKQSRTFKEKIRRANTGPAIYAHSSPGEQDQGRDAVFELTCAEFFQERGVFSALEAPADVVARVDGVDFQIECKRPRTANNVSENVRGACSQLRKKVKDDAVRLVAVDLTRVANPNFRFLEGGMDIAAEHVVKILKRFIQDYQHEICDVVTSESDATDQAADGFMMSMSSIVRLPSGGNTIITARSFTGLQSPYAQVGPLREFARRCGLEDRQRYGFSHA